jgi:hypothetical protein
MLLRIFSASFEAGIKQIFIQEIQKYWLDCNAGRGKIEHDLKTYEVRSAVGRQRPKRDDQKTKAHWGHAFEAIYAPCNSTVIVAC